MLNTFADPGAGNTGSLGKPVRLPPVSVWFTRPNANCMDASLDALVTVKLNLHVSVKSVSVVSVAPIGRSSRTVGSEESTCTRSELPAAFHAN